MDAELLRLLREVTPEEQKILDGTGIDRKLYTGSDSFTVESGRMLANGELIRVRTHTRFIGFPRHKHNYIESMYTVSYTHLDVYKRQVFVVTGLTAACAGVLQSSRLATGSAIIGDGFELDAITSVILGGTALSVGKGNIWGSFIGALLLSLIRSGLNILGVDEAFQKLAIAVVLLFALSISGIKIITQEAAK